MKISEKFLKMKKQQFSYGKGEKTSLLLFLRIIKRETERKISDIQMERIMGSYQQMNLYTFNIDRVKNVSEVIHVPNHLSKY